MAEISPNVSSQLYIANGITTAFAFPFSVVSATDVLVLWNGAAHGTGYSVTYSDVAGTVTFQTPPPDGTTIRILLDPDYSQTSEFADQGAYNLSTVNLINRRAAIKALATEDKAVRALKAPLGETGPDIPAAVNRAGALLAFDEDGKADTSRKLAAFDADVAGVAASAGAAAGSAGAAAGSASSAATNAGAAQASATAAGGSATAASGSATAAAGSATAASGSATAAAGSAATAVTQAGNASASATAAAGSATAAVTSASNAAGTLAAVDPLEANNQALPKSSLFGFDGSTFSIGNNAPLPTTTLSVNSTLFAMYALDATELARAAAGGLFTFLTRVVTPPTLVWPTWVRYYELDADAAVLTTHDLALTNGTRYLKRDVALNASTRSLKFEVKIPNAPGSAITLRVPEVTTSGSAPAAVSNNLERRAIAGVVEKFANRVMPVQFTSTVPSPPQRTAVPAFGSSVITVYFTPAAQGDLYTIQFRSTNAWTMFPLQKALSNGSLVAWSSGQPVPKLTHTLSDGSYIYTVTFSAGPETVSGTPYDFIGLKMDVYNATAVPVTVDNLVVVKGASVPPMTETPPVITRDVAKQITDALAAATGTVLGAPLNVVDIWGNSLIDYNHSPGSVSTELATLLGVIVTNNGIATQTAHQIFMRAGGSPVLLSLVGDSIPSTTTPVTIRNFNAYNSPITQACSAANGTDPLAGSLGGVLGVLSSVRAGGAGAAVTGLTFTRTTAGSAVPTTPNTQFLPTLGETTRSRIQVFAGILENNIAGNGVTVANEAADMIDRQVRRMLPVDKRYVVGSVNVGNQPSSAGSIIMVDMNQAMKKRFGAYFVDLTSAPTTEEMVTIGFSPTPDDLYDMDAIISGSSTGGTLTVTSVSSGAITIGKYLDPEVFGVTAVISAFGTGTGGTGTYTISYGSAIATFTNQTLKGFVPRGMRGGGYSSGPGVNPPGGDQLHGNNYFNKLWALRIFRLVRGRGWA